MHLSRCMRIIAAHLGPEHISAASILFILSQALAITGKLAEAFPLMSRAVHILKANPGSGPYIAHHDKAVQILQHIQSQLSPKLQQQQQQQQQQQLKKKRQPSSKM